MTYVGESGIALSSEATLWFRCLTVGFNQQETHEIRRAYAWGTIRRIVCYIPDEFFRYTQIFLSAMVCWTAHLCGAKKLANSWTHSTNELVISKALHTFSRTYYSVGWLDPRAGLMLNSLARITHRSLSSFNWLEYRLVGYRSRYFPIDFRAFADSLEAKVARAYHVIRSVFAGTILAIAELDDKKNTSKEWIKAIRPMARTVRDHLSIPIFELAMSSPNIGQRALIKIAQIIEWGLFPA